VCLDQDIRRKPVQGRGIGEDLDDVGASLTSRFSRSNGFVPHALRQFGEVGERGDLLTGPVQHVWDVLDLGADQRAGGLAKTVRIAAATISVLPLWVPWSTRSA